MTEFSTEQEKFWSGEFGRQYIERNQDQAYFVANLAFFSKPLARTTKISSILELSK